MYKIALISDIHFGCRGNSEKYLTISKNFFLTTLVNVIKEHNITDVRILGDLFDNRNSINVRTMNTVINVFKWYQKNMPDVHFQLLKGNHDIYYHNRIDISSIELLREFENIEIVDNVKLESISGKTIASVPWIASKESQVAEGFYNLATGDKITDYLFGHFEIKGFEMSPGIEDETGYEHGVFSKFGKVITGHYHLRSSKSNITYLGCPYQLTWGDYGDIKGIHILNVDSGNLQFIENKDSPVHVKVTVSEISEKKAEALKNIKNNFVKLIVDKKYKDSSIIKLINKIESLSPSRLDVENQYVETIAWDESNEADLDKLNDPFAFLVEYSKVIDHQEGIQQNKLIQRLSDMYQMTVKEND
jgi:hypothetical protein